MRNIWVIGANIFRQLLRNRILAVLAIFALGVGGLSVFLAELGQESEARLGRDFGLMAVEWMGFFTVLLCHVVLLFEETELKTISMLMVKPVRRWEYLLGKLVGSAILSLVNIAGLMLVLLAVAWFRGWHLASLPLFLCAGYLWWQSVVVSAVVLLFSVMASSVPACVVFSVFTFGLGHFTTNLLEWIKRMDQAAYLPLVKALYYLLPNLTLFSLKDALSGEAGVAVITPGTLLWPIGYGLCYGGAVFLLAAWQYERKEY